MIGDRELLYPDVEELVRATETLVGKGFIVLPYCNEDPVSCRKLADAGAAAVVGTLWDVDDRATASFMAHFYEALITRGRSPAAALRAAVRAQQQDARWSHPRDWAGFVLIGYSE